MALRRNTMHLSEQQKAAEANGWNEPEMDAYDNYDKEVAKQCE